MLDDKKTGVLALGSFSDTSFDGLEQAMISGLQSLKAMGATQLVVDVVSDCLAELVLLVLMRL